MNMGAHETGNGTYKCPIYHLHETVMTG